MKFSRFAAFVCGATLSLVNIASSSAASATKTENLVLGGGCFWCLEAAYEIVPGVLSVVSGYAGGDKPNPTYKQVCSGDTGHAEVVRIEYDPAQVSLERLFELFWVVHDPTTLNRQGNDEGTQYRSIILYATEEQKAAAEKAEAGARARYSDPIVTQIVPLEKFYEAEREHQNYFRNNPNARYCRVVVRSKVEKMQQALGK